MTMIEWMMVALRRRGEVKRTVNLLQPRLWISVCEQIVDGKPVREVPKAAQVCLLDSSDHLTSHHHWDCDTNEWNGCHTIFITNGVSILWSMQLTYRMYKGDTLTVKGRMVQQLVSNVSCRTSWVRVTNACIRKIVFRHVPEDVATLRRKEIPMIKVYVACEFGRMDEAVELALALQIAGFDVVSTWLLKDKSYDPNSLPKAIRDYLQVKECDLLVYITGKSVNANCEVGLAMGMGKPVICVGDFSGNIFTTIPYLAEWMKREEVVDKLKERYQYA